MKAQADYRRDVAGLSAAGMFPVLRALREHLAERAGRVQAMQMPQPIRQRRTGLQSVREFIAGPALVGRVTYSLPEAKSARDFVVDPFESVQGDA